MSPRHWHRMAENHGDKRSDFFLKTIHTFDKMRKVVDPFWQSPTGWPDEIVTNPPKLWPNLFLFKTFP
jgi:hypothetical protein